MLLWKPKLYFPRSKRFMSYLIYHPTAQRLCQPGAMLEIRGQFQRFPTKLPSEYSSHLMLDFCIWPPARSILCCNVQRGIWPCLTNMCDIVTTGMTSRCPSFDVRSGSLVSSNNHCIDTYGWHNTVSMSWSFQTLHQYTYGLYTCT